MNGIYIPGMEMPTSCAYCPMLEGDRMDGLCHAASRWLDDDEYWTWYVFPEGDTDDSKPCNCPLVSVPEHGDLIDRKALVNNKYATFTIEEKGLWGVYRDKGVWLSAVENAPTIIPASGGNENE